MSFEVIRAQTNYDLLRIWDTNKIAGNNDVANFYIGQSMLSNGGPGLDIHWYYGVKFSDYQGEVFRVENGALNISGGKLKINGNTNFFGSSNKIFGNKDPNNYYIGHYEVPGSDGLDIHWHGGIKLIEGNGAGLQIQSGNVDFLGNGLIDLFGTAYNGSGGHKIFGNNDPDNYYIGHYAVAGGDGLDIHWYNGIRLSDHTGNVFAGAKW